MGSSSKSAAADIAAGLGAFVVVRCVPRVTGFHQDIRPFILTVFAAFLFATFARARSTMAWRSALIVACAGILPAVALRTAGISLTANVFFVSFLISAAIGVALGLAVGLRIPSRAAGLLAGVVATLLAAPIAYTAVPRLLDEQAYRLVNQPVTHFALTTLDGRTLDADTLRGHVVVASFWATWCLPCQEELPKLQEVAKQYSGNSDVLVIAVDSGTHGDTAQKVRAFALRKHLQLPIAIDSPDGEAPGPAARSFSVRGLPALYILDKDGNLRAMHFGYEASEDFVDSLKRQINRLL